ncbi:MAG: glucosylceramidase [Lachnospiraceae bacterium]|nr:glucosylceramidase [Lachnospiraceae bacterium]
MKYYVTDAVKRLEEHEVEMNAGSAGEMGQIKVYPDVTYQTVQGIGGALTEAAAYSYSNMSEDKKKEMLDLYFGENGNNYNFCRLHIQSCDFALDNYAYIEDPEDKELKSFSLERDNKYIIPLVKAALAKKQDIVFLASPWSPPAFMKTNNEMNHGGQLKKEYYGMWADMVVRYVKEYRAMGIDIRRLTVQNEPAAVQTWDSCIYSATEEAEYAVGYLKPALEKAGLGDIKINIWDHNKEIILDRANESFAVDGAKDAIDGVAFHWYSGDHFEELAEVARTYPDKELIFTEGCVEYSRFASDDHMANAEKYAHDMLGDFLAGANAFIDWNIYLDAKGGPNHVGNFCDAPVMCDFDKDEIDVKLSYYYIGHFSRFVKPGAKRVLSSRYTDKVESVAFVNPDGEKVLIVLNTRDDEVNYTIFDGENNIDQTIAGHSIITYVW